MTGLSLPPASEIARAVREGEVDPLHFASLSLERARAGLEAEEPLRAFLALNTEEELTGLAGPHGVLAGVPVGVKDNLVTLDLPTTCASRILENFRSPYEATAVRRVREAGGVVIGKTNMDEFAMGSSTEHSAFGPTTNPLDPERVPGGSSGGSAAAVAAGLVPVALGSETGGSVRQPAAFCGVVGTKPTYGRVSRYGLVAFASSLDQVGTFGRSVEDAALLLEAIAGHDPRDSTSEHRPVPALAAAAREAAAEPSFEGVVIGVPNEYFPDDLDRGVRSRCEDALAAMDSAGAEIRQISLPHTRFAIPTYYVIASAEASSNLARYDGVRFGYRAPSAGSTEQVYVASRSEGFGAEVKRRIMLGTYALSAGYYDRYYGRAQEARRRIAGDFRAVFAQGIDLIFTPTSPTVAFRRGEKTLDPYEMYLSDIFTATANLAGIPGISIPVGEVGGLPAGGQLLAPWWAEEAMIQAASALEALLGGPS